MRTPPLGACAVTALLAVTVTLTSVGCSSSAAAADLQAGDCVKVSGPPDRPETDKVACGSAESNFKVMDVVEATADCPTDADTYYSMRSSFSGTGPTICMDIDWVVGGCMSIDPNHASDPLRVDCDDASAPNRQRATQVLVDVANVDQCASGVGYAYDQRQFTVCVEDVS